MLSSTIREFARATPFTPFVVQMTDGRRFTIADPDYVSVSPKESKLIVYDTNDQRNALVQPAGGVSRAVQIAWNPPSPPAVAG